MKKWLIHQPPEEAAKQIRSGSDLSIHQSSLFVSSYLQRYEEHLRLKQKLGWQCNDGRLLLEHS